MIVMSRHLRTWNIAECRQEAAVCPTPPACTRATTSARRAEYTTRICVAAGLLVTHRYSWVHVSMRFIYVAAAVGMAIVVLFIAPDCADGGVVGSC